ncbi:glycosyltransferase family 4 protein [Algoriphagus sp. Y33]|uniref:glycosyltransferase family 4 protein n=1 Tax=Algoriphagus sp. Y33 TaxID=2772483 RepID=UPI00177C39AB|nr:glycosyltransferase family 4 protein [Algoriphagus sp. Y33]
MHQTAIIYHYFASYRLPIFLELMQSKKVEFTLYSGVDSEIPIKRIDSNLSSLPIEKGGLRWKFLKNHWLVNKKFLWQSGLISIALKSDFDSYIFLGSPYFITTWLAVAIVRLRGKKAYFWMHGVYKDKPTKVDWLKLNIFYKMATGFFLYGNRALSILRKHKVKPDFRMHVIYNSLDYEKSLKLRKLVDEKELKDYRLSYFSSADIPIVVFIGRLNFVKRIDMLIDAQYFLKRRDGKLPFNILLIGEGEEKSTLVEQSKELGLDENVKFLGAIYDEEINANALLYADLCVTPGEVGLTAMHAMSYGVPVISHNNLDVQMPEVEAIQNGVTGNLFEYGSVENLSETICCWLAKYPVKTKEIMEACFSVIDTHYNPYYQKSVIESVLLKD